MTEYTISPNKIDLNNEYRIRIEKDSEFDTSIFRKVYAKAKDCVNDIVKMNIENSLGGDAYNNIIVFEGERGKGKSSAMISFQKSLLEEKLTYFDDGVFATGTIAFLSLDVIDPSYFNGEESLFEIIIAKMFSKFKERIDCTKNRFNDNDKRQLVSAFQKVFEDLKCIKNRNAVYNKDPLDALIKLSSSTNLKNSFCELIELYLIVFGCKGKKNQLIITIDDFDLNIDGMYGMMEDIRQFLIIQNVIILIACKYSQVKEATYLEFYHRLYKKINNSNVIENIIDDPDVISKGDRYLEKLLPHNRIIELLDLNTLSFSFDLNKPFENLTYIIPKDVAFNDASIKNLKIEELESPDQIEKYEAENKIYIGETFQRSLFKYFYLKEGYQQLFICNRKELIFGLAPNTFRGIYSLFSNTNQQSLADYVKSQIHIKLNQITKSNKIKSDLKEFYILINDSLEFIEENDFVVFNSFFISTIKSNSTLIEYINYENQANLIINSEPLLVPNSIIYSCLFNILNNSERFDIKLFQLIDQFILFYYLKSKMISVTHFKKFKFFTPTYSSFLQKLDIRSIKDADEKDNNRRDIAFVTSDSKEEIGVRFKTLDSHAKYLFSHLIQKMQTKNKNSYYTLPFQETNELNFRENFTFEFLKIFQPTNSFDFEIGDDIGFNSNDWFSINVDGELSNKHANLFYNPFFFDFFVIKYVKNISANMKEKVHSFADFIHDSFSDVLQATLEDVQQVYPYLKLDYKELIKQNPLLNIYHNNILKNLDSKSKFDDLLNAIESSREKIESKDANKSFDKIRNNLKNKVKSWKSNTSPTFITVNNIVGVINDVMYSLPKFKSTLLPIKNNFVQFSKDRKGKISDDMYGLGNYHTLLDQLSTALDG